MSFLWTDRRTQRPSNSTFWKTVAYAVGTYVIVVNAATLSWELLLVYLAVIGGSEVATRIIELRFGKTNDTKPNPTDNI
jgi:NhaP-type Na+/H+ or K+/H+ antiporter